MRFAIEASKKLLEFGIKSNIWSITSFNELAREYDSDQQKILNKGIKSYVESCFEEEMATVAVSEYQKLYSEQIRKWVNGKYICLGTDGYGRSDTREKLREFFEIDSNHIVFNALLAIGQKEAAKKYIQKNKINLNMKNPYTR